MTAVIKAIRNPLFFPGHLTKDQIVITTIKLHNRMLIQDPHIQHWYCDKENMIAEKAI
jgi:hypothetical protein